jgi:hypothetical protein
MAKLSGGGITSNKLVREGVRGGSPNLTAYSPRGVSQLGYSPGSVLSKTGSFTSRNSAVPLSEGQKRDFVPMGNSLTNNVGPGGPGSGRDVMRSGSQGTHGPVAGPAPVRGRDIFGGFPPEVTDKNTLVRK